MTHPAVQAHYDGITVHNGPTEPTDFIPNHEELTRYLSQLPADKEYEVIDPEADVTDVQRKDAESYEQIGLDVMWSDDNRGYGGCYMVRRADGRTGVYIYVNGCSMASAPGYWILPTS
jgi:hypothetical protein